MPGFRIARAEVHGKLLGAARDDAALMLIARSGACKSTRGEALRHLLYLFEKDEAIRPDPGGLSFSIPSQPGDGMAGIPAASVLRFAHRLRRPRGRGHRGQLLLRIGSGWISPADIISVIATFRRDVEFDHFAALDEEEKAGGRVGRARQEHRDVLGLTLRQPQCHLPARRLRQEHQRPHSRRRKLDQRRPCGSSSRTWKTASRKSASGSCRSAARSACGSRRLSPSLDQRAADQVGGEEAEQRQRDDGDDQAGAGDRPRQIGLRPVGGRDERTHQVVDPVDERPGQIGGDRQRPGDDQAGEEIVAEPRPGLTCGGSAVLDRAGRGRRSGVCEFVRSSRQFWFRVSLIAHPAACAYSTVTDFARLRG